MIEWNFSPLSITDILLIIISGLALILSGLSFKRSKNIEMPIIFTDSIPTPGVYIVDIIDYSAAKNLNIRKIKYRKFGEWFYKTNSNYHYRYKKDCTPPLVEITFREIDSLAPYKFIIYTNYSKLKLKKEGLFTAAPNH